MTGGSQRSAVDYPNVKAKASMPESRNSISKLSISDWLRLSDQLIQPRLCNGADALVVYVNSASSAGRLSIDEHAKSHGSSSRCRSHDEMKIAGLKAVRDPPVRLVQHSGMFLHRPITRQCPMIESQLRGVPGVECLMSRRPSELREAPSRPPVVWTLAVYGTFLSWVMVGMGALLKELFVAHVRSFGSDLRMRLPDEISTFFKITRRTVACQFMIAHLPEQ
jgi:hypothetical protein